MTTSEAIDAAARLLDQFPNAKSAGDGFIGALVQVFGSYPRQAVVRCIDPLRGVARENQFLSVANVVGWLERDANPMHQEADRERRVAEQLRKREEWEKQQVPKTLKEKGQAWLDRSDPVAAELLRGQVTKQQLAAEAKDRLVREFGQEAFDKCRDAKL